MNAKAHEQGLQGEDAGFEAIEAAVQGFGLGFGHGNRKADLGEEGNQV